MEVEEPQGLEMATGGSFDGENFARWRTKRKPNDLAEARKRLKSTALVTAEASPPKSGQTAPSQPNAAQAGAVSANAARHRPTAAAVERVEQAERSAQQLLAELGGDCPAAGAPESPPKPTPLPDRPEGTDSVEQLPPPPPPPDQDGNRSASVTTLTQFFVNIELTLHF